MKIYRGYKISATDQKESLKLTIFTSMIVFVIFVSFRLFPIDKVNFFPPCPWFYITKTYCPGCGTMRGISSVVNGNIPGLFQNNLLAGIASIFLIYSCVNLFCRSVFGYQMLDIFLSRNEILFILTIILIYGILRNFIPTLAPKEFVNVSG